MGEYMTKFSFLSELLTNDELSTKNNELIHSTVTKETHEQQKETWEVIRTMKQNTT